MLNDLRLIYLEGKAGYINLKGDICIPNEYENGSQFSEGVAFVRSRGRGYFIDMNGSKVCELNFSDVGTMYDGRSCVSKEMNGRRLYGFVDKQGEVVIPLRYEKAGRFEGGMAPVKTKEGWGFIDIRGRMCIPSRFETVVGFKGQEVSTVVRTRGTYRLISKEGKLGAHLSLEVPKGFSQGVVPVSLKGKWALSNSDGEIVVEPRFEDIGHHFNCGYIAARFGGGWTYIDVHGNPVGELRHTWAFTFSDGLGAVVDGGLVGMDGEIIGGRVGYLNVRGELEIKPQFDYGYEFMDGIAQIDVVAGGGGNYKLGYIDRKGNYVWKPTA